MDDELHRQLAWLALNRLPHLGPVAIRQLLDHAGGLAGLLDPASTVLAALKPEQARPWLAFCAGEPGNTLAEQARRDLEQAQAVGARVIPLDCAAYPPLLAQVHAAPIVLFVRGDSSSLQRAQLGVVGSRQASPGGLALAREFASALAAGGLAITSGLALGIDGAAHLGALDANGITLAVTATGIEQTYPARHRELAERIVAAGGAILSEFAPGTPPAAHHFPRRNRIISGLSLGVLVVEAGLQSGSLVTARYALEQNRDVFALPGSVRSMHHRGCHALIRQGAMLVETPQDIVDELGALLQFRQREQAVLDTLGQKPESLSADALQVFRLLDHTPATLDTLVERCALPVEAVSAALMDLEMEGVITQEYGLYNRR